MPKSRNKLVFLFKCLFVMGFITCLLAAGGGYALYSHLSPQLPAIDVLKDVRLQVPLRVYSSEGDLIAEFGEKRREPVLIEEVPELLKNAYLAAEDDRFYEHPGVDYQGLIRAGLNLIRTGQKGQGGSTITMQVARNFFLTREKTYLRKINEIFLALKIERELPKDKILELYLNKIYLGNRAYGVGAASKVYYGVELADLTLAQVAMIAGLPKAPSKYNPIAGPERALIRRNYVLDRMLSLGMIDREAHELARAEEITARIHGATKVIDAGYVGEMARTSLVELFEERAYTAGFKVYTTVKTAHQDAANRALRKALLAYEERQGYRGPLATLSTEAMLVVPPDKEKVAATDGESAQDEAPETVEVIEWEAALGEHVTFGDLQLALVTAVEAEKAELYLQGGATAVMSLDGIGWTGERRGRDVIAPENMSDALAVGDIVRVSRFDGALKLAQLPTVEGAFVSLNPQNGAIQSLVGGFDFQRSKFNRVTQAERQHAIICLLHLVTYYKETYYKETYYTQKNLTTCTIASLQQAMNMWCLHSFRKLSTSLKQAVSNF